MGKVEINFSTTFPNEDSTQVVATGSKVLLLSLDTEYQSNYTKNGNLCLSYQYDVVDLKRGKCGRGIYYVDWRGDERLTFLEVVENSLSTVGMSLTGLRGYTVIVIAHFFVAELLMLKDREKLKPYLDFIRKTVITNGSSTIPIRGYVNRNKVEFDVMIKDTMLLVPETHKALKKASKLVDKEFAKLDLKTSELENMLTLMQESPKRYEAYALRDTAVTLNLFIKLQIILNRINKTKSEIYSTLSSASVKSFRTTFRNEYGFEEFKNVFRPDNRHLSA